MCIRDRCKQDTLEAYEMMKPYVEYIHIKDARWDDASVVPPGTGDGHVAEILSLIHILYKAFLNDPLVKGHNPSVEDVKKLADDMIENTMKYLPEGWRK